MRLFLTQRQSPGDVLCLTAAVRDLKAAHPDWRINVRTSAQELWDNNPHLDGSVNPSNADRTIDCEYPAIHRSNERGLPFIYAFHEYLAQTLGVEVPFGDARCDVHLSDAERAMFSSMPRNTAIIDAGHKMDYTAKMWEWARYQEVVDRTRDRWHWVQIGAGNHVHRPLRNVEDMIGRTTLRQLAAIMYQASMVLTPVSMPMHLATMEWRHGRRRPCVVVAGGREPSAWEAYTGHQYVHRCGCYPCCAEGGCWRSRITPLGDGDPKDGSLCVNPVRAASGQIVPLCMADISVDEIVRAIEAYRL